MQFVPQGSGASRDERLVAVSDAEIARRLAAGRQDGASWIASNEHWSLGGQQSKFALRRMDGRWYSCKSSAATAYADMKARVLDRLKTFFDRFNGLGR